MLMTRTVSRSLAFAAAMAVVFASTAGQAGAFPQKDSAAGSEGGVRITGTLTWKQFTPASQLIAGATESSGGETETGTFKVDLADANLPFSSQFTVKGSTYQIADKVSAIGTTPDCTVTLTGGGSASGEFQVASPADLDAGWWAAVGKAPLVGLFMIAEGTQTVTETVTGSGMDCHGSSTTTSQISYQPICWNVVAANGNDFDGAFDGKTDTIAVACAGDHGGITYSIKGTLHVDAYTFILPPSLMSPSKWHAILFSKHHDHASIDIPVPLGTPYFAVTAGIISYTNATGACGLGIVLHGLDGVTYTYCHGSYRGPPDGEEVAPGTLLGLTGNTGHSSGPHLHFQISYNAKLRCPQTLLWSLYDNTQPPPDSHTIYNLPTTGCIKPA
jgi:Peptidase family M23